jgi:hypothetical protein
MNPSRTIIAAFVSLAVSSPALAQGPCDLVLKQAAEVLGAAAGKPERMKPVANTEICTVQSTDRAAEISLTIQANSKADLSRSTARMIATMAKDPGQTVKDEHGLGKDAFSIREKDKFFVMFGDTGRDFSIRFGRDRGVTDADVERARQFAKQLFALK